MFSRFPMVFFINPWVFPRLSRGFPVVTVVSDPPDPPAAAAAEPGAQRGAAGRELRANGAES